jgi:hypothetical protein
MMTLFFVSVKRTAINVVSMFSKKDFSVLQILNTFDELTYCNNNNNNFCICSENQHQKFQ